MTDTNKQEFFKKLNRRLAIELIKVGEENKLLRKCVVEALHQLKDGGLKNHVRGLEATLKEHNIVI